MNTPRTSAVLLRSMIGILIGALLVVNLVKLVRRYRRQAAGSDFEELASDERQGEGAGNPT